MRIKSITIKNVKGIANKTFNLDLYPNKPSLLVAPNGFGKSSIAIAFDSMNSKRMTLDESNHHQCDTANEPEVSVELLDDAGNVTVVTVNKNTNTLSALLDVFVIKSMIVPKANKIKVSGFTQAKPSLEVKSIELDRIIGKSDFSYSPTQQKTAFGVNGKVLPNITELLRQSATCSRLKNHNFTKYSGQRITTSIAECTAAINGQSGNTAQILAWTEANILAKFKAILPLNDLANQLQTLNDSGLQSETVAFLAAVQVVALYNTDPKRFASAIEYNLYAARRDRYKNQLNDLYGGWAPVELVEDKSKGRLVINFPKANQFSNGQRDFLSLVFAFEKAAQDLRHEHCLLVIDEIFDYLDDANLIAFQYFITNLIDRFKSTDRKLFPILLTHLDPAIFHHFCFNGHKLKVHYLDVGSSGKSADTIAMIIARDTIANAGNILDADYFHYNPTPSNHVGQFAALNLRLDWEDPALFHQYIESELIRYLENKNFDPMAICFAVRILVEKAVYELITDPAVKMNFITTHTTSKKLDFAASLGIEIPEIYFLLGLIYNDGLHWKTGRDLVSPMSTKLKHPVIRYLISRLPR